MAVDAVNHQTAKRVQVGRYLLLKWRGQVCVHFYVMSHVGMRASLPEPSGCRR